MGLYQRIAAGAEAGVMAGIGVILLFLFQDVVRLDPVATPEALALGLFGPHGVPLDATLVARAAGIAGLSIRLIGYTFLHLLAFAGVGVAAAFVLRGASWLASLAGGALFGVTFCTAVFYGSRWVMDAPVQLEAVGFSSILVANTVAGVILGGGLYLVRSPGRAGSTAEEVSRA